MMLKTTTGTSALLSVLIALTHSTWPSNWAIAEGGGWTSSGGDPQRLLVEEGRRLAAHMIEAVRLTDLQANVTADQFLWFSQNQFAMREDVLKAPFEWTVDPAPTCAHTEPVSAGKLFFSLPSCQHLWSTDDAAKLLLHETIHHFQIADESFADEVAVGVSLTFHKTTWTGVSVCQSSDQKFEKALAGNWRLDRHLTSRLQNSLPAAVKSPFESIHFSREIEAVKEISGIGECALTAGRAVAKTRIGAIETMLYVVALKDSVPHLYFFKREGTDPQPGLLRRVWEISLVDTKESGTDLLFIKPGMGPGLNPTALMRE